jgi:hypothetical protein
MTHLALSETVPEEEGPTVTWGDHVTDEEYAAAIKTSATTERAVRPTPQPAGAEPQPRPVHR